MLRRRRYNYVTPTSYLELLSTFLKLLAEKRTEVTSAKKRLESGLDKLTSTANQVEDMQKELQELQPVLAATAKEVEDMMQVIAHDKEDAAQTKRTVEQQEREANEQAAVAKSIAGEGPTMGACQCSAWLTYVLCSGQGRNTVCSRACMLSTLEGCLALQHFSTKCNPDAASNAIWWCLDVQMMRSGSWMLPYQPWMPPLAA